MLRVALRDSQFKIMLVYVFLGLNAGRPVQNKLYRSFHCMAEIIIFGISLSVISSQTKNRKTAWKSISSMFDSQGLLLHIYLIFLFETLAMFDLSIHNCSSLYMTEHKDKHYNRHKSLAVSLRKGKSVKICQIKRATTSCGDTLWQVEHLKVFFLQQVTFKYMKKDIWISYSCILCASCFSQILMTLLAPESGQW